MTPIIEPGEMIHIIMRQYFKEEVRRNFVGEVIALAGTTVRAEGYTFTCEPVSLVYRRLPELRTRIFGLQDGGLIINLLPKNIDVSELRYNTNTGFPMLVDGKGFRLEISEFKPA